MSSKTIFTLPQPYPVPRVIEKNPYYAKLLLEDYTGAAGELTAITQYMFHSFCLPGSSREVANMTRQIAITEMKHLELLGKTIDLLGVSPRFRCTHHNRGDCWTSEYIYYGQGDVDRLSANIAKEAAVISNYRQHLKMIDDPYIKELLARIIQDEELHLRLFQQAKDSLGCIRK